MTLDTILQNFQSKVSSQIRLEPVADGCYRILTPFQFSDGDHPVITVRSDAGRWALSDEGHTAVRLGDRLDERVQSVIRQQPDASTSGAITLASDTGELTLVMEDGHYGDALNRFIQALLRIDVAALAST